MLKEGGDGRWLGDDGWAAGAAAGEAPVPTCVAFHIVEVLNQRAPSSDVAYTAGSRDDQVLRFDCAQQWSGTFQCLTGDARSRFEVAGGQVCGAVHGCGCMCDSACKEPGRCSCQAARLQNVQRTDFFAPGGFVWRRCIADSPGSCLVSARLLPMHTASDTPGVLAATPSVSGDAEPSCRCRLGIACGVSARQSDAAAHRSVLRCTHSTGGYRTQTHSARVQQCARSLLLKSEACCLR